MHASYNQACQNAMCNAHFILEARPHHTYTPFFTLLNLVSYHIISYHIWCMYVMCVVGEEVLLLPWYPYLQLAPEQAQMCIPHKHTTKLVDDQVLGGGRGSGSNRGLGKMVLGTSQIWSPFSPGFSFRFSTPPCTFKTFSISVESPA